MCAFLILEHNIKYFLPSIQYDLLGYVLNWSIKPDRMQIFFIFKKCFRNKFLFEISLHICTAFSFHSSPGKKNGKSPCSNLACCSRSSFTKNVGNGYSNSYRNPSYLTTFKIILYTISIAFVAWLLPLNVVCLDVGVCIFFFSFYIAELTRFHNEFLNR